MLYAQNPRLDSLLQVLGTERTNKERLQTLSELVDEYSFSDAGKTAEYLYRLKPLAEKLKRFDVLSEGYVNLGWAQKDQGNPKDALQSFEQALRIAERARDDFSRYNALHALGASYSDAGQFEPAVAYYKRAIRAGEKAEREDKLAVTLETLGYTYRREGSYDSALQYYRRSLALQQKLDNTRRVMNLHFYIGHTFDNMGELDSALLAYQKAREVARNQADTMGLANSFDMLGNIYNKKAQYRPALQNKLEAVALYEKLDEPYALGAGYFNLAGFFKKQEEYDKARRFMEKSLASFLRAKNEYGIASVQQGLGELYYLQSNYEKADTLLRTAMAVLVRKNWSRPLIGTYRLLGQNFRAKTQYDSAQFYLSKAYRLAKETGASEDQAQTALELANTLQAAGNYGRARSYAQESLRLAEEKGYPRYVWKASGALAESLESLGQYQAALQSHKRFKTMTDSLRNEERTREITRLESEFAFNQERDSIQFAQKQERLRFERETEQREARQRLTYIGLGLAVLLLIVSMAFYLDKQKNNRKLATANHQLADTNEELKMANEEIRTAQEETQSLNESLQQTLDVVQKQKQDITDSINYAQRIQAAILPSGHRLEAAFPNHFIFFRPRDVVSGDFYWLSDLQSEENKVIFAAVDCTGHGVPGAFMSMVGNDLLNHIVNERHITEAGAILTQLHLDIRRALNQAETNNRDGMDIALVVWDKTRHELQFAGAKNPLVYIQNGELHRLKADRMPIGGQQLEKERIFTTQTLALNVPTICYLFSDGFQDQFGGPKRRKYMSKRFRELLFEIHTLSMLEQQQRLSQEFNDWCGQERQIDDVLVAGLRFRQPT